MNHPSQYLKDLEKEAELERKFYEEEDFAKLVFEYFDINAQLLISKHRDYGPKNISQSPGGALNGLRVRMHDKLASTTSSTPRPTLSMRAFVTHSSTWPTTR